MSLSASREIERPPEKVWQFVVVHHVRNHPHWDPRMSLEQVTDGPIGLGTRIRRRHTRTGAPIEGTMEVVDFDPPHAFGVLIRDETPEGSLEVRSRMTLGARGAGRTRLTIEVQLPGPAASMDPSMLEDSLGRMKELIESET